MKDSRYILTACMVLLLPDFLPAAETIIYKKVEGRDMKILVEKPPGWTAADQRPAIVFFFGGGWVGGTPEQFRPQSTYFASRGMVGLRVEYRTIPKGDNGPPLVCCADAKSAMRYVRSHAAELGVDPRRIAGAGGSAGGHLAAFTALVPGLDDPQDDLKVNCRPDALVLEGEEPTLHAVGERRHPQLVIHVGVLHIHLGLITLGLDQRDLGRLAGGLRW